MPKSTNGSPPSVTKHSIETLKTSTKVDGETPDSAEYHAHARGIIWIAKKAEVKSQDSCPDNPSTKRKFRALKGWGFPRVSVLMVVSIPARSFHFRSNTIRLPTRFQRHALEAAYRQGVHQGGCLPNFICR